MIVVKLVGGLASQLHKYAIIKNICDQSGHEMKVDLSFFSDRRFKLNSIMEYGLPKLGICPEIATKADIAKAKGYNLLGRLISKVLTMNCINKKTNGLFERGLNKLESYNLYRVITSRSYVITHVSRSIEKSWIKVIIKNENSYVFGEFGVGFEDIEGIRAELAERVSNASISDHADNYKQMILREESPVAVHIRRGDYVNNINVNKFHGVCPIEYYKNSIDLISRSRAIRLFIFSDDLNWVKENFSTFIPSSTVFVSGNEGYEDFILMTCCKYHIIANSGFSSIASWLSMAPGGNVYSPARWFIDEETNNNQKALLPSEWNYV